ncbi:MAG: helix-turn-helix transcriptional regulator [Rhodospirillales bacterium]
MQTLTSRERDILHLPAEGVSNKTIAAGLDISVRTVEFHRKNILKKVRRLFNLRPDQDFRTHVSYLVISHRLLYTL